MLWRSIASKTVRLQTIADELHLNPIKVRKLLITAGVYKSEFAGQVQNVFSARYRQR